MCHCDGLEEVNKLIRINSDQVIKSSGDQETIRHPELVSGSGSYGCENSFTNIISSMSERAGGKIPNQVRNDVVKSVRSVLTSKSLRGGYEITDEAIQNPVEKLDCHADKSARNDSHSRREDLLSTSKHPSQFTPHSSLTKRVAFTLAEVFSPHFAGCRKVAFTLAEVLITLGIIGVVAAMTLPTLVQNYQEKATVVKLKKMYSILSQAYQMYLKDNEPEHFYTKSEEGARGAFEVFKPSLKLSKDCGTEDFSCIYTGLYTKKNGTPHNSYVDNEYKYYKVLLADGSSLMFRGGSDSETPDNSITSPNLIVFYDVNGKKPPNKWGEDMFDFLIYGNQIYPNGHIKMPSVNVYEKFADGCSAANAPGYACAAWVIFEENMDYLHCADLDWHGKTKCD